VRQASRCKRGNGKRGGHIRVEMNLQPADYTHNFPEGDEIHGSQGELINQNGYLLSFQVP